MEEQQSNLGRIGHLPRMRKLTKYEKILQLVENRPMIALETCRKIHPEISSGTFHSIMNILSKHNLVKKIPLGKGRLSYRKTSEYSIEEGIEIIKARFRELNEKHKKKSTVTEQLLTKEEPLASESPVETGREGTFEAKRRMHNLVEDYMDVLKDGKRKSFNEERVSIAFIAPMLEALGWDLSDGEVSLQSKRLLGQEDSGSDLGRTTVMLVVVGSVSESLNGHDRERILRKTFKIARSIKAEWVALTNFEETRFYYSNVAEPGDGEVWDKPIRFMQYESRFDELWLMSKQSILSRTSVDAFIDRFKTSTKLRLYVTSILEERGIIPKGELIRENWRRNGIEPFMTAAFLDDVSLLNGIRCKQIDGEPTILTLRMEEALGETENRILLSLENNRVVAERDLVEQYKISERLLFYASKELISKGIIERTYLPQRRQNFYSLAGSLVSENPQGIHNVYIAQDLIRPLVSQLEITTDVVEKTYELIQRATDREVMRGRKFGVVALACLYLGSRLRKAPRPIYFFAKTEHGSSLQEFQGIVRSLIRHLQINPRSLATSPKDYLPYLVAKLTSTSEENEILLENSLRILRKFPRSFYIGKNPLAIACVALYVASSDNDLGLVQREIADVGGITETTLRKHYRSMAEVFPKAKKGFASKPRRSPHVLASASDTSAQKERAKDIPVQRDKHAYRPVSEVKHEWVKLDETLDEDGHVVRFFRCNRCGRILRKKYETHPRGLVNRN